MGEELGLEEGQVLVGYFSFSCSFVIKQLGSEDLKRLR